MSHRVFLTADAERDLERIIDHIAENDLPEKALYVLARIQTVIDELADFPHRGNFPKELLSIGIRDYREVYFKPYRIIYRVIQTDVFVYLIADGRRDMQALLERRLLEQ